MKAALGAALGAWLLAGAATAQTDGGIELPPAEAPPPAVPGQVETPAQADAGIPAPVVPAQPQVETPAQAQPPAVALTPPPPKTPRRRRRRGPDRSMNTISFNLVRPLFSEYSGTLERAMTDLFAIDLDITYVHAARPTPRGTTTIDGFAFMGGVRFFLLGKAPSGLFVGPDLEILNLTIRETFGEAAGTTFGLGAEAGYAIILWTYLYLSASVGAEGLFGYVANAGTLPRGIGWAPILKANVGVAF